MSSRCPAVHPRACGEQIKCSDNPSPMGGSSPRMRGTVQRDPLLICMSRFIPAHAGNREG